MADRSRLVKRLARRFGSQLPGELRAAIVCTYELDWRWVAVGAAGGEFLYWMTGGLSSSILLGLGGGVGAVISTALDRRLGRQDPRRPGSVLGVTSSHLAAFGGGRSPAKPDAVSSVQAIEDLQDVRVDDKRLAQETTLRFSNGSQWVFQFPRYRWERFRSSLPGVGWGYGGAATRGGSQDGTARPPAVGQDPDDIWKADA